MRSWLLILLLSGSCFGQAWSNILSSSRAVDWRVAGLPSTLPDGETVPSQWTPPTRTQCGPTLTPSGGDDVAQINAAVAGTGSGFTSCTPPYVVVLGSGNFQIKSNLRLGASYTNNHNNVTVRGSGPMSTTWTLSGDYVMSLGASSVTGRGAFTSAAGNYTQGQNSFILQNVVSSGDLVAGNVGYFVQCDNGFAPTTLGQPIPDGSGCSGSTVDPLSVLTCDTTACSSTGGGNEQNERQAVRINSVTNNGDGTYTITTSSGLYMADWAYARGATFRWNSTSYSSVGMGLEDLTIRLYDGGTNGVQLQFCYGCWVKGVRYVGYTLTAAWSMGVCSHCLIANNYHFQASNTSAVLNNGSYSNGYQDTNGSDNLIINNINQQGESNEDSGDHEAIVFAYNYSRDVNPGYYQATQFEHGSGSSLLLREGNEYGRINDDSTFGSHNLETAFRNWLNCGDTPYDTGTIGGGFQVDAFSRFTNLIGNVIGIGMPAKCPTYQGQADDGYVYNINGGPAPFDGSGLTGLTAKSLMRWGNYDSVTAGVTWSSSEVPTSTVMPSSTWPNAAAYQNSVPVDHNLPCSFFMKAYPGTTCTPLTSGGSGISWWKTCDTWTSFPTSCSHYTTPTFPPIGPDISGYANDIPAAIAWKTLPIDTTYQNSYTVTSSSWSGGTETLNFTSGLPTSLEHFMGGFQLASGLSSACYPTGVTTAEILMTSSSVNGSGGGSVKYALTSNPGTSCNGTMKFPDVRQFDEKVYQADSGTSQATAPTFSAPSCPYTGLAPTVTIANSNTGTTIVCKTTDNSTPVTNTLGTGCTNGTQYITDFPQLTTATVKAVAGTSTLSDSTVTSCSITVTGQKMTGASGSVTVKGNVIFQ